MNSSWVPEKLQQPSVNREEETFSLIHQEDKRMVVVWSLAKPFSIRPPTPRAEISAAATGSACPRSQGQSQEKRRGRTSQGMCGCANAKCMRVCVRAGRCVPGSVFVLQHEGFKIRCKGVCVFTWVFVCVHKTGNNFYNSHSCVCVCVLKKDGCWLCHNSAGWATWI